MGLIEKLKLLFKERQPATDLINEVKQVKSGWKTLPFWIAVVGTLGAAAAGLDGIIPASAVLISTTVLTMFYNILRGATKADLAGTKPIFQTSEFWLSVLSQVSNAITSLKTGGINPAWLTSAGGLVAAAMAAGQNLAAQQPNAPPLPDATTK